MSEVIPTGEEVVPTDGPIDTDTASVQADSDKGLAEHTFIQTVPSMVWKFANPLRRTPNSLIVDVDGDDVEASVMFPTRTMISIVFEEPQTGRVTFS